MMSRRRRKEGMALRVVTRQLMLLLRVLVVLGLTVADAMATCVNVRGACVASAPAVAIGGCE